MKIGVFDSGFGGLSVFREMKKQLPGYDYLYLGDTARAPYGNHSQDIIYSYTRQAVDFLFQHGCKLVILACNTASAQALRKLQQEWLPEHYPDRRVLGVIRPVAEEIAKIAAGKKIGVIGTRATIEAGVFTTEIEQQLKQKADILEQACPLLVPLVEEGFHKRSETKRILRHYLRPLKRERIDVLINGCTHYQLLEDTIRSVMGKRVEVVDTPEIVANSLEDYLQRHPEIEEELSKQGKSEFLTTDLDRRFNGPASRFFEAPVKARRVHLEPRKR